MVSILEKEQQAVQKFKHRSRTLKQYSYSLQFEELTGNNLETYLTQQLKTKKNFVWADFGCGNQIAIREAKYFFNTPHLKTYSIDILKRDSIGKIINQLIQKNNVWCCEYLNTIPKKSAIEFLLKNEFEPIHFKHDIASIILPEKADFITSTYVLPYLKEPYTALEHIVTNLKTGGEFFFSIETSCNEKNKLVFNKIKSHKNISIVEIANFAFCKYTKE
jgi:hypothetical protein